MSRAEAAMRVEFRGVSRRVLALASLGLAALLATAAPASATTLHVEYRLSLAGLTLGKAELDGSFAGDRYELAMKAQLTGIAGLFTSSGRGGATAKGVVSGTKLLSAGFAASARSGSSDRTVQMAVASGNAGTVEINPPFEPRPDRIPVSEADKRGIIDPLSGILGVVAGPAKAGDKAACDRSVPVFDGSQRFDLVLTYAETKSVGKPGLPASAVVCNARYVPVSGHRPSRWAVKYMAENRDLSVWLAPVEGTRFFVPLRINIMTYYGLSVADAEKWELK